MPLVVLGILMIIGTTAGVIFNAYILFLSCSHSAGQNRTATHFLLFHLGLINITTSVIFLFAFAPAFFKEYWLSDWSCKFLGPSWNCLQFLILWTVTFLNIDKYVTISSPLHYARLVSPTKTVLLLAVTWIVSGMICLSPVLIPDLSFTVRSMSGCVLEVTAFPALHGSIYVMLTTFVAFIFPILLISATNGRILMIARHHRHRIVSALWDVTVSAQATVTQQKSHFYLTRYRGRSAATTMVHHVGTLFLLYVPYLCCIFYETIGRKRISSIASTLAFMFMAFSPLIHGFVYGVRSKVLRKNFMNLLRRQLYKSEVICEIQARVPSASGSRRSSITPSITLPFQKQLTRRMSEILIQPSSSSLPGNEASHPKLVRQSSETSWKLRTSSCPTPILSTKRGQHSPIANISPSLPAQPDDLTDCSVSSDVECSSSLIPKGNIALILPGRPQTETKSCPCYNGVNRQSLRRALFAKNKQQSLEMNVPTANIQRTASACQPTRSISHNQMEMSLRPLLSDSEPLSLTKKSKRVSWSSDSVSVFETVENENDRLTSLERGFLKRQKQNRLRRQNNARTKFSKDFFEQLNNSEQTDEEKFGKEESDVLYCETNGTQINVRDNPFIYAIQNGSTCYNNSRLKNMSVNI